MSSHDRPVNLDLTKFDFPVMAIASITHRITGVILFVGFFFALYALDVSLRGPAGFARAGELVSSPFGGFVAWGMLTSLGFHFVAGVKHLVMDLGHGESLEAGRRTSVATFVATAVIAVLAGVWVW